MKLFLVTSINGADYDCNEGFVIRARTSHEARSIAQEVIADEKHENASYWLRPEFSTCTELKPEGKAGLILNSFHAG